MLAEAGAEPVGHVVIGTVQGDLHDIGKNLVASMLEGGGFKVTDLGVDVPPERFVEAAKEKKGTIVALSALLTTTMTMMKNVIQALEKAGIRQTDEGDDRRRPHHAAVRRRDRRRRLQRQRQHGRGPGQEIGLAPQLWIQENFAAFSRRRHVGVDGGSACLGRRAAGR